jgi:hypothetical protein
MLEPFEKKGPSSSYLRLHLDERTALHMLIVLHSKFLPASCGLSDVAHLLQACETYSMDYVFEACCNRLIELAKEDELENEEVMNAIWDLAGTHGTTNALYELLDEWVKKEESKEDDDVEEEAGSDEEEDEDEGEEGDWEPDWEEEDEEEEE